MGKLLRTARRAARRTREEKAGITPEEALKMPLSEFARAGLLLAVRFPMLDEPVFLASDNARFAAEPGGLHQGRVVFRAREWRQILDLVARGMAPADLRLLYEARKTFGGELLPDENAGREEFPAPSGPWEREILDLPELSPFAALIAAARAGALPAGPVTLPSGGPLQDPAAVVLCFAANLSELSRPLSAVSPQQVREGRERNLRLLEFLRAWWLS